MQKLKLLDVEPNVLEIAIEHLPEHHSFKPPVARERGDELEAHRMRQRGFGEQIERIGVQRIAHEHRQIFAVFDMQCRVRAAQRGVVHAGQIVMNERIGVQALERERGLEDSLFLRESLRIERENGGKQQARAESLAAVLHHFPERLFVGWVKRRHDRRALAQKGFKLAEEFAEPIVHSKALRIGVRRCRHRCVRSRFRLRPRRVGSSLRRLGIRCARPRRPFALAIAS